MCVIAETHAAREQRVSSEIERIQLLAPRMDSGVGGAHQHLRQTSTKRTRVVLRNRCPVTAGDRILTHQLQMILARSRANTCTADAALLEC